MQWSGIQYFYPHGRHSPQRQYQTGYGYALSRRLGAAYYQWRHFLPMGIEWDNAFPTRRSSELRYTGRDIQCDYYQWLVQWSGIQYFYPYGRHSPHRFY